MIKDILERVGGQIVGRIKENLRASGQTTSGKTEQSLRFDVTEREGMTTLTVSARPFFRAVETGSKPSTKNPSPEMIESIKEWKEKKAPEKNEYAIAKTILKKGSKLWRAGGRKDIYSNVLEEVLPGLRKEISKELKNGIIGS